MASIERAVVLGLVTFLFSLGVLVLPSDAGVEPHRWYEVVVSIAAAAIVGLSSAWPNLPRILIGGLVLFFGSNGFDMLFDRPRAFAVPYIAVDVLATVALVAVLPWLDPPRRFGQWCGTRTARWALFYPAALIIYAAAILGIWAAALTIVEPEPLQGYEIFLRVGLVALLLGGLVYGNAFPPSRSDRRAETSILCLLPSNPDELRPLWTFLWRSNQLRVTVVCQPGHPPRKATAATALKVVAFLVLLALFIFSGEVLSGRVPFPSLAHWPQRAIGLVLFASMLGAWMFVVIPSMLQKAVTITEESDILETLKSAQKWQSEFRFGLGSVLFVLCKSELWEAVAIKQLADAKCAVLFPGEHPPESVRDARFLAALGHVKAAVVVREGVDVLPEIASLASEIVRYRESPTEDSGIQDRLLAALAAPST
ncbi:MAG TPA: hypothetical protein VMI56_06925 [Reyranella sp.]|nr:hypothetical protein [Reyranella sp.]